MNTHTPAARLVSGKDDVKGTAVYSPAGEELGHINDVMIDPGSGKVVYGVLQFGGFLGIGSDTHPIPFGKLRYDAARGGYITDLTPEQLQDAPVHDENWRSDREWQKRSYDHFGVPPYWY